MRSGVQPTASQVNVDEYMEFFEPFLKDGQDVLHVCLSSGISGAYNAACMSREQLAAKYPDRKLKIMDSLGASSGYGMLMDMLADVRRRRIIRGSLCLGGKKTSSPSTTGSIPPT